MNQIKTWLYLLGIPLFLILIGDLIAHEAGVCFAVVIIILMYINSYRASSIALRRFDAKPIEPHEMPELRAIVTPLAQKVGLPVPALYLIQEDFPNAFSVGHTQAKSGLAVTTGLLKDLNKDELTAVIAHELSHIKHQDTLIATVSAVNAGFISGFANSAPWKRFFEDNRKVEDRIVPGVMAVLGPIAAFLIKIAVSSSKEFDADREGAKLCDHPQALISALEKIENSKTTKVFEKAELYPAYAHLFFVNPLRQSQLLSIFHIQPPTAERIRLLISDENAVQVVTK